MKKSTLKYGVLSALSLLITAIIVLMPFHAFLTVWLSSLLGHYTALRLWKEALLLLAGIGAVFLLLSDTKIRSQARSRRVVWLIAAYAAINLVWGLAAYSKHDVTLKALGYGLIINLRFLTFFLVTWAVSLRIARLKTRWPGMTFWPAAVVVSFGLLQIAVLPHDFLRHFGYGATTIVPMETINHNAYYIRIASTLRGANPLGAYLLIPISATLVLLLGKKRDWRHLALLLGSLVVLFFSFSRSAWIGALIACAVILVLRIRDQKTRQKMLIIGVSVVLAAGLIGYSLRHNTRFENLVFHTQTHSTVAATSNEGHLTALTSGVNDIVDQPIGRGTGTAGPASVYNHNQARIAENYYVQIGQELGVLGAVIFVAINLGVGYLLWLRREDPFALWLFASFVGLSFINLLSHAWADDTIAYVWWGLAGIAMATQTKCTSSPSS